MIIIYKEKGTYFIKCVNKKNWRPFVKMVP